MFKYFRNIKKKEWFKVFALNSFSVAIKFLTGIITSRVISVYLGATGIAMLENIRNLFSTIEAVGVMGIQNAVMHDVIASKINTNKLIKVCATAFYFVVIWCSIICGLLILFFDKLEYLFIRDQEVLLCLKLIIIFYPIITTHLILQAVINGLELYKKLLLTNIVSSIVACICNVILIYKFQVLGAIIGTILIPFLLVIGFSFHLKKQIPILPIFSIKNIDFKYIKSYGTFSKIAVVSGVLLPVIYLSIRNFIIKNLGWEMAGHWSAITRVSSYYFMFITTLSTFFFYPKIAKSSSYKKARIYILSYFKIVLPIFFVVFSILYLTRNYWIQLLFTKEFLVLSDYVIFQFIGDFIRIAATIFSYYLLAKKYAYKFIISEIVSLSSFYLASIFLVPKFNLYGVLFGYILSMVLYLGVVFFFYLLDTKEIKNDFILRIFKR